MEKNDFLNQNTLASQLENKAPSEILADAINRHGHDIAFACSFDIHGTALLHMLYDLKLLDKVQVFYLDTGVLFDEIHQTIKDCEKRYGFKAVAIKPETTWQEQCDSQGLLYKEGAKGVTQCCQQRKTLPLKKHLSGFDAWITGLARDQSPSRSNIPVVHWDDMFELVKYNPAAAIDWNTLWAWAKANEITYCKLYDQGYASIGCNTEVCTQKGSSREGRWVGTGKTECGIHLDGNLVQE